jgi:hypothetical protein
MQFTFSLGGALSLCIAQTIFANKLEYEIRHHVPEVSVEQVLAAGAYKLSELSEGSPLVLDSLRRAYKNALRDVFFFALAAAGAALLASLWMENRNLKTVAAGREQEEEDAKTFAKIGDDEAVYGKVSV